MFVIFDTLLFVSKNISLLINKKSHLYIEIIPAIKRIIQLYKSELSLNRTTNIDLKFL